MFSRWWALPFGVMIWVAFWYLLLWNWPLRPSLTDDRIIYYTVIDLISGAIFVGLPAVVTVIGAILYGRTKRSIWRGIGLFAVTVFAGVIGLWAIAWYDLGDPNPDSVLVTNGSYFYGGEYIIIPQIEHVISTYARSHRYNLLRYDYPSNRLPIYRYNFYRCDSLGISCDLLYHHTIQGKGLDGVYADLRNPPQLVVEDDTLALFIAGERVYTYPLP